jgi:hypothetical protein
LNRQGAKIAKFFKEKFQKHGHPIGEIHILSILAFTLALSAPWRFQLPFFFRLSGYV